MNKNNYLGYKQICRSLIDFICSEDVENLDSRFVDSDGDFVSCDMGYLLEGLRNFEEYFDLKFKVSRGK